MLKFIRQFLHKSSEPEEVQLSKGELGDWIKEETENKRKTFSTKAEEINSKIEDASEEAFTMIDELESKQLQNENIPVKEKHYMEGNRNTFVKTTRDFLKTIPLFKNPAKFLSNYEDLNAKLQNLHKANQRSYQILQHFFANETKKITAKIKEIEDNAKSLNEYYNELGLPALENTMEKLEEQEKKASAHEKVIKDLQEKQYEVNELKEKLEDTKTKLKRLEEKSDYSEYREISKRKDQIVEEIRKEKESIENILSNLKQPLKKNQRIAMDEELNETLLQSPSKALLQTDTQKILQFLDKLKQNIEKDTIELKDKKKDKALSTISQVNSQMIDNFKNKVERLQNERKELETKLRHSQIMMDYTDLVYKRDHLQEKLDSAEKELHSMQSKASKTETVDYEGIVEELNQSLPDKRITLENFHEE